MIRVLFRHHPMFQPTLVKWLLLIVSTTTMWLGVLTYQIVRSEQVPSWPALVGLWLVPAGFLALGGHTRRARTFALTLPVPARRILVAHTLAVLLISALMLLASFGVLHVAASALAETSTRRTDLLEATVDLLPEVWLQAGAWWLLLLALILTDRPGLVQIPRGRRWLMRSLGVVAGCFIGLLAGGTAAGRITAAGAVLVATALVLRSWRQLPAVLSLAPLGPLAPAAPGSAPLAAATGASRWRRPLWLVIALATAKYSGMWVFATPFMVLMGLFISSAGTALFDGMHLGPLFAPVVAYGIFSMTAAPLSRLTIFDHLPISRGRLLACVLLPTMVLVGVGYAGGEVLAAVRGSSDEEPLVFNSTSQHYGVHVSTRFAAVAWGEVPTIVAPNGRGITPPDHWRPFGPSGPLIYNPFHTPMDATPETCAWQLERASARVFDRAIPATEFLDRYLEVNEYGATVVKDGELALRRDHPGLRVRSFPGLPPLVLLETWLLLVTAYAVYLGRFRPGKTERARKASFVLILVLLMGIYLAPIALDILGVGRGGGDVVVVLMHAFSHWLVGMIPGGALGLWLIVLGFLLAGARLLLDGFRRAEWPPVREDDAVFDVLG